MIRTIWIIVLCWISLSALTLIKVNTATLLSADFADAVATNPDSETALPKSDKLTVLGTLQNEVATASIHVPAVNTATAAPTVKFISRRWHDPLAPPASQQINRAKQRTAARQTSGGPMSSVETHR
jgi:hypothetical protein